MFRFIIFANLGKKRKQSSEFNRFLRFFHNYDSVVTRPPRFDAAFTLCSNVKTLFSILQSIDMSTYIVNYVLHPRHPRLNSLIMCMFRTDGTYTQAYTQATPKFSRKFIR